MLDSPREDAELEIAKFSNVSKLMVFKTHISQLLFSFLSATDLTEDDLQKLVNSPTLIGCKISDTPITPENIALLAKLENKLSNFEFNCSCGPTFRISWIALA